MAPAPASEPCPLCGAPLDPDQEWCLKCGAAARTRLAASPNWKTPLITVAVICALALGVLAAALVSLACDSGPAPAPKTTTVTSSQPVAGTTAPAAPGTTTPAAPGTTTVTQPGATVTTTAPTSPTTTGNTSSTTTTAPKTNTGTNGATHTTAAHGALEGLKGLKLPAKAQQGK